MSSSSSSAYCDYLRDVRSHCRDFPSLSIEWENLSYSVQIPVQDQVFNLHNALFAAFGNKLRHNRVVDFHALEPSRGLLKPGSSTLILAPPGHGKSLLLKALAGQLNRDSHLSGTIRYNGLTAKECANAGWKLSKLCHYLDQGDIHLPLLTVRETFQFALNNSVVDPSTVKKNSTTEIESEKSSDLKSLFERKVDLILDLLELRQCENTVLGNSLLRGVSGGERKRVSIGEAMITNARALFLDEITTGLDARVAYGVNKALNEWSKIMDGILVSALQQPTPEQYDLFDNLILLRSGEIVYFGPRAQVGPYFNEMGIRCPRDQDEADWLVDFLSQPAAVFQRNRWKELRLANLPTHRKRGLSQPPTQAAADELQGEILEENQISSLPDDATVTISYQPSVQYNNNYTNNDAIVSIHYSDPVQPVVFHPKSTRSDPDISILVDTAFQTKTDMQMQVVGMDMLLDKFNEDARNIDGSVPPLTAAALRQKYHQSEFYHQMAVELESRKSSRTKPEPVFDPSSFSLSTRLQFCNEFSQSFFSQTLSCIRRQKDLMLRNSAFIRTRLGQSVVMGLIIGSLYYQLNSLDFSDRLGVFLYTPVVLSFSNVAELTSSSEAKQVLYKQHDATMYHPLAYLISVILIHLIVALPETIIFGSIIYLMAGHVFLFYNWFFYILLLFCLNLCMSILFRFIAYVTKNSDVAQQISGPTTAAFLIFGGFLITSEKIPDHLIEFYWVSPFSWALRSLAQNEFFSSRYSEAQADVFLGVWQISTNQVYKWAGVFYLLGLALIFALLSSHVLAKLRSPLTVGTKRIIENDEEQAAVAATAIAMGPPAASHSYSSLPNVGNANRATLALPFKPMNLSFRNLTYTIQVPDPSNPKKMKSRQLLNSIHGYVRAGTLSALMGSSGAGKTTLMDVLAGRKTDGTVGGEIYVDGFPIDMARFQRICGYCEQQDIHMIEMTVREALQFSAKLRLDQSVTETQREAFVDEILEILELKPIADRIIGDSNSGGLSPGQLKLVTIGVELAANPTFLFLDEPTSGLDSRAALVVMRVVKRVAQTGRAVLVTIHQPCAELFYHFDRLLLLQTGGSQVFFGEIGEFGDSLIDYFEQAPLRPGLPQPSFPRRVNPASWMLDVIAGEPYYATVYKNSLLRAINAYTIHQMSTPQKVSTPSVLTSTYAASYTRQFSTVFNRFVTSYYRNVAYNLTRFIIFTIQGILFGNLYLQISTQDEAGLISKVSAIFMAMGTTGVVSCSSTVPALYRNRAVFYREQSSRMYTSYAFSTSLALIELFYVFIGSCLFVSPFYWLVGFLGTAIHFFKFLFAHFLVQYIFNSWGQFLVSFLPNLLVLGVCQGISFSFLFLFMGVFRRAPNMAAGWKWLYYIDFIPKGAVAVATDQFACNDADTDPTQCPQLVKNSIQSEPISVSSYVQDYYLGSGSGSNVYWYYMGWAVLTIAVLRLGTVLAIAKIRHLKR